MLSKCLVNWHLENTSGRLVEENTSEDFISLKIIKFLSEKLIEELIQVVI